MNLGEKAWRLLQELTQLAPITGSEGEGRAAQFIYDHLKAQEYFQNNPGQLRFLPLAAPNSPGVVAAIIKGRTPRTVILLNHHDVVSTASYGRYRDLAFSPLALTRCFDADALPPRAAADLKSGDWVFGRGTMDMLFGLALQLVTSLDCAEQADLEGNIVFLSVPDEENNSLGMRHAVALLREFQRDQGLDYIAAVNSEPHGYDQDGHVVQTGSDGKLLPLIYCRGRETHAGALYDGLNPHVLLAQIISTLELNPGFCDRQAETVTFPPTVLQTGAHRTGYNVSTPQDAWAFVNLFTLGTTPADYLEKIHRLCQQAAASVQEKVARSATAWKQLSGQKLTPLPLETRVVTYAQLYKEAGEPGPELDALGAKLLAEGLDLQELTVELVRATLDRCSGQDPVVVIAIAPPFYPPLYNRRQTAKELLVMAAVTELQRYAQGLNVKLGHSEYHRGISDLSYCALQGGTAIAAPVKANCPAWDRGYHLPLAEMALIDAPAVNLGPWGRDVHQWTERIHKPFATEILPQLLSYLIRRLLQPKQ